MYWRYLLTGASLLGALGVILGAFAGHALKDRLDDYHLKIFEVGSRYHMLHVFALIATALIAAKIDTPTLRWAGYSFFAGVFLFSGSLYLLAVTGTKWLGAITPIGGLLLITGWLLLAWSTYNP